jgi:drug/metabolite transporter (DMT)-like permease
MSLVLGVIVAACFGTGDFLGGLASRRTATLVALGLAQTTALVGAVVVALIAGGEPTTQDHLLGALAGLLNVAALGCLFQGLSIVRVSLVAPLAAVIGAFIPVGWGLLIGERPSAMAMVGVVLAVTAAGLISRGRDEDVAGTSRTSTLLALAAGVGFGLSFICFVSTGEGSGMWPVLTARAAAVVGVGAALVVARPALPTERVPVVQSAASGVLDVIAAALLLIAARAGLASTVAPVAALGPAFTVGHARWFLRERSTPIQIVGLALALVGLALIAAGG